MSARNSYPFSFKLEVVEYAKLHDNSKAAKEYGVDRKRVREWRNKETSLKAAVVARGQSKRKRLRGGGRKVKHPELEDELHRWVLEKRALKLSVSGVGVLMKARQLLTAAGNPSTKSRGWLNRFMRRRKLSKRKRTTTAQKPPVDYIKKIVDFILYVRAQRQKNQYAMGDIYGCDKTAVWFDMASNTTLEETGAKDVMIKSTGHEKLCVTVMLTAKADGTKLKPYVLLARKRPVKELEQFRGKLVIKFAGTTWMNDDLTADYVKLVIGIGSSLFRKKRLLVWDSFNCHITDAIKKELKVRMMDMAVVPGGCTKFVQPADVSWNKPFKEALRKEYDAWMAAGDFEYTAGGNMRAAPTKELCEWITRSWDSLSPDMIRDSFKCCGITVDTNGTEDHMVSIFKDGRGCEVGREQLAAGHAAAVQELEADEREEIRNVTGLSDDEDELTEDEGESAEEVDSSSSEEIESDDDDVLYSAV